MPHFSLPNAARPDCHADFYISGTPVIGGVFFGLGGGQPVLNVFTVFWNPDRKRGPWLVYRRHYVLYQGLVEIPLTTQLYLLFHARSLVPMFSVAATDVSSPASVL
jgi:hypothetical protein